MPDAGEVKAKVVIEYDGSGIEQAKKDLASLGEMAGAFGSGGGGGGGAGGGGLPAFAQQISSVLSPMQQLRGAFENLLPLVTQQNAAFDQLPRSLVSTMAPMQQLQGTMMQMIPALPQMVQGLSQVQEITSGALPRSLASTVEPMQQLQGVVSQSAFALAPYAGGLEQVQSAAEPLGRTIVTMVDPMSQVQQIAGETGAMQLPLLASSLHDAQGATDAFTQSYGAMNSTFSQYSKGMPPPIDQATIDMMNSIPTAAGNYGTAWSDVLAQQEKAASGTHAFADIMNTDLAPSIGGFLGGFNRMFMEVGQIAYMAPMIGQAFTGFGSSIYASAKQAGAPAAPFVQQMDIASAQSERAGEVFATGFGKAVLPFLTQYNASQDSGFQQWAGPALGHALVGGNLLNAARSLIDPLGLNPSAFTQAPTPMTTSADALQSSFERLNQTVANTTSTVPLTATQAGAVYNQMQREPLAQQLADIQSGQFQQAMQAAGVTGRNAPIQTGSLTIPGGGGLGEAISNMLSSAMSGIGSISMPSMSLGGIASGIGSMLSSALSGLSGISMPSINLGGITSGIGGMLSSALSGLGGISMPSISLGGIASGIGGMLSSALSGLSSISMPSISLGGIASGVSSMLSSALSGLSGISIPSINLGGIASGVSAMLSSALSGLSGISLPSINLGGLAASIGSALSSALSGLSNISIPGLPHFASGVENFSGGWAIVGEHGPEPVRLPAGSSVYPASSGAGIASLAGIGGGGSGPQVINFTFQLDSQTLVSTMGIPLASAIRLSNGYRGA